MIISHKHKFIFIKTRKTAGARIEIALSKFCCDEDIITPISSKDEAIKKEMGLRGPQNYQAPYAQYKPADFWRLLTKLQKKLRYYNHIPAVEIKALVGDDIWNSYYKFCFERNPFDRLISTYFWICRHEPRPSIAEFLISHQQRLQHGRCINQYTENGNVMVDQVFLFEEMGEALMKLKNTLGFSDDIVLPRTTSFTRKDKRHYREVLSQDEYQRISEMMKDEIQLFGYESLGL